MLYAQIGNTSDVMIYPHDRVIECFACLLADSQPADVSGLAKILGVTEEDLPDFFDQETVQQSQVFTSRTDALAHLKEHILAGHMVPPRAIQQLERELAIIGNTILPDVNEDQMVDY